MFECVHEKEDNREKRINKKSFTSSAVGESKVRANLTEERERVRLERIVRAREYQRTQQPTCELHLPRAGLMHRA